MGKLAKAFMDIINEQDFCFEPHEMKIVKLAIRAVEKWEEEQNKSCYGCAHLRDALYDCKPCARFGYVDYYVSRT